ncbi:MAG TPA: dienelactone hydrolase family protein, partial [Phycisphaerales bacterium]|nr:dienelactone hydrolase family protein [Phycisphaerales bacterium]
GSVLEELRLHLARPVAERGDLAAQAFASAPLARVEVQEAARVLWEAHAQRVRDERKDEWERKSITLDGKTMKFDYRIFGEPADLGRSMFISMHGGGGAPPEVNEQQWKNQIGLYAPEEGIYVAPRAPTDTWNLWHEGHIDGLFDRLISDAVVFENVDPDRVYVMGYSAGGDGVYQLAPRMADRWAAAAMMAGHPNEAQPLNLRNVPFVINMGGEDKAYNRNTVAAEWGKKLDELRAADPEGYEHEVHIRPGLGHWMKREDASAVPWMMQYRRNPWPTRVAWRQDDVLQGRMYWLERSLDGAKAGDTLIVSRKGQEFTIEKAEGVGKFSILLSDDVVDMDAPIRVVHGEKVLFEGKVERTVACLWRTLEDRGDRNLMFAGKIDVECRQ